MRNIDQIIVSGQWEIEPMFGMQMLAKYLHELDLVEKGVKLSEINYSEQRAALEPVILNSEITGRTGLMSSDIPEGSIAKLSLSGAMRLEDGMSSRGVRQLIADIQVADSNPNIAGIILEVNSGGGEVTAGTELKNALDDVRSNGQTKVVVYAQQMASAAVRATLPAHYIIANNESAHIGSIGTMITIDKFMLDYAKENFIDLYAKQSTKKNDEYREMLKGNFKPLENMLTNNNQHFLNEVDKYRKLKGTQAEISTVLSGALFTADIALQRGLIDGIGTFGQAVEKLKSLLSNNSTSTVNPEGEFFNKSENMDFKSFISKLIPGLNSFLGLELKEDAKAEEVLEAVNNAQSFEDRFAEMKAELTSDAETLKATIKAELAEEQADKLAQMDSRITELSSAVETLQAENAQLQADKTELENQITALETQKAELDSAKADLEGKIVELKGKRGNIGKDGSEEATNSGTPNVGQFQTANNFYAAIAEPPGESDF